MLPALLFKIAWRNVFRNKRRTCLTLCILGLGCTGLILVGGFFDNIMEGLREQYIHGHSGHLQVNVRGFHENGISDPLRYLMKDSSRVLEQISANPRVRLTVPRLKLAGMVSTDETSVAVSVLGVDPAAEREMGEFQYRDAKQPSINIVAGKDLDVSDLEGAVLGQGLMKALKIKVGESFTLLTVRDGGSIDGAQFTVRGSFETIFKDLDDRALKINLSAAQKLLGVSNEMHTLIVLLEDTAHTSLARQSLDEAFKTAGLNLELISWLELSNFYRLSKDLFDKINRTIQLIFFVVFFFSIANTVNMSLFERMREFGTMMAIGNGRGLIVFNLVLESCLIGLMGATLGIGVGAAAAKLISAMGIEMPPPPMGSNGYYAMISLNPGLLLQVFLVTTVATAISAVLPALRLYRLKIVNALGYV